MLEDPRTIREEMVSWRSVKNESHAKTETNALIFDLNISNAKLKNEQKKKKKNAQWSVKVARYLSYCMNGGLLNE